MVRAQKLRCKHFNDTSLCRSVGIVSESLKIWFGKQSNLLEHLNSCKQRVVCFNQNNSVADSACHYNSLVVFETSPGALRVTQAYPLLICCRFLFSCLRKRPKMNIFNPDRFFKRWTIFSNENFGLGDQNFQDQIPVTVLLGPIKGLDRTKTRNGLGNESKNGS